MSRESPGARWLGSPHFVRATGGPEALAAFRRLGEAEQHEVVAFGDRLAEESVALAHAYGLRAPAARTRLGARGFARWAERGLDILGPRLGSRDGAAAYFRLEPERLAAAGEPLCERWLELAEELQAVSRKLAALFLEGSGAVLDGFGAAARGRLEAWVRAGIRLAGSSGWRGEFLAAAYFTATPQVLALLAPAEIEAWAALGAAVQTGREIQQAYFTALPKGFAALGAAERASLLALAGRVAAGAPRAAAELFARLPAELARLDPSVRGPLLRAFAAAASDVDGLVALLPMLVAVVSAVPQAEASALLERAAALAEHHPLCLAPLLRSLPRAREEADRAGVRRWIERGAAIAEESTEAGKTYFALESRTALRALREGSVAVHFEEVQGVLRSFSRMFSGVTLDLRAADGTSLRPFLDAESLGRTSVALPETVDVFGSWEDNFTLLKLAAANAVGRLFFGTFDLSVARVVERLPPALGAVLADLVPGDDWKSLLEVVPEADPLLALFAACDGARIDARLSRAYRGHAADLRRAGARLARRVPPPGRSAEVVLFLLGAGIAPEQLGSEEISVELLQTIDAIVRSPAATVDDALAAAILLRERLADSIAISGFAPETIYEDLLFEKMTGDAFLDPEPEGAEEPTGARPTELLDVEPARVEEGEEEGRGTALSAEELRRLLEAGAILKVGKAGGAVDSAGIFAKGLKLPPGAAAAAEDGGEIEEGAARRRRGGRDRRGFEYDEWDYTIRDYRPRWCFLEEVTLAGDAGEFFHETLTRYGDLLPEVRRQFQRIRPERYQKVRGLEDGEDFDLNAAVAARIDLRARRSPSPRIYVARRTEERDVATLFLLDMSASTDEPLVKPARPADASSGDWPTAPSPPERTRRIIDVTKEALVIMAEALEELGDRYAIYGFSGQGRENVEFYDVKQFNEGLNPRVRGRIGGIEPRRSTRMGTALRHALTKMTNVASRSRHIFLLSDGFPQDFDYGQDRRSNVYGIQDTMMAIQECQAAGVTPFCITVDKTGHDYLRQMCETSRYLVLDDVASLPTELPKIYERWVRG